MFAGREQELQKINELTNYLAEKEPPARDIILYGPRGNGKTTLLNQVATRWKKNPSVSAMRVLAGNLEDDKDVYTKLMGEAVPYEKTVTTTWIEWYLGFRNENRRILFKISSVSTVGLGT